MVTSSNTSVSGDGYPVESSSSIVTSYADSIPGTPQRTAKQSGSRMSLSPPPMMTTNNLARLKIASEVHWTLGRIREKIAQEVPIKMIEGIKRSGNPELLKYSLTESTVINEVMEYISRVSNALQLIIHNQELPLSVIIDHIKSYYQLLYSITI